MKIVIVNPTTARLTPTGGRIRHRLSNMIYCEVYTAPKNIWLFEDADSVHYEEVPIDTLPEDVREAFDSVVSLIVDTAVKHDALDDLRNLPAINIASLFALAHEKGVGDAELTQIIAQVVMLKTDIEARMPRSWHDIWNGNLKPYILAHLAASANASVQ